MENDLILKAIKQNNGAFYLLDSKKFIRNFEELKVSFSSIYSNFNIAYSYKTNYIPKLCQIVNEHGGYAETVSEMEVELALKIGVNPKNIIWNGPVKQEYYLHKYLLLGVQVNIDNYEEFCVIQKIVNNNRYSNFNLGIRVNFDVGDFVISRFGFDPNSDKFKTAISFIQNTENVVFSSLQCHFAKRQIEFWPARVKGMLSLLNFQKMPKSIDLGGGMFGKMPPFLKEQFDSEIPDYASYAKIAAYAFKEKFGNNGPMLLIEPGSALVGDCVKFVCQVKSIKTIRGKNFATVLGSQKNISMSSVNPPIEVISLSKGKLYSDIDIVGYTCIESDILFHNYRGHLAVNDIVLFGNCGSYSIVMKPPFILPNFAIVELSDGFIEIIKRAETFDDIFHSYIF